MKRMLLLALTVLLIHPLAGAQEQTTQKINKKDLVIKEWNTDVRTNRKYLDHVTTFSPEGKKIEEIEYSVDGLKWRKRYEYGEDGRLSRELLYDERSKLVNYKKFEYNAFGRKQRVTTYSPKGKVTLIKVYEYLTEDAS